MTICAKTGSQSAFPVTFWRVIGSQLLHLLPALFVLLLLLFSLLFPLPLSLSFRFPDLLLSLCPESS